MRLQCADESAFEAVPAIAGLPEDRVAVSVFGEILSYVKRKERNAGPDVEGPGLTDGLIEIVGAQHPVERVEDTGQAQFLAKELLVDAGVVGNA